MAWPSFAWLAPAAALLLPPGGSASADTAFVMTGVSGVPCWHQCMVHGIAMKEMGYDLPDARSADTEHRAGSCPWAIEKEGDVCTIVATGRSPVPIADELRGLSGKIQSYLSTAQRAQKAAIQLLTVDERQAIFAACRKDPRMGGSGNLDPAVFAQCASEKVGRMAVAAGISDDDKARLKKAQAQVLQWRDAGLIERGILKDCVSQVMRETSASGPSARDTTAASCIKGHDVLDTQEDPATVMKDMMGRLFTPGFGTDGKPPTGKTPAESGLAPVPALDAVSGEIDQCLSQKLGGAGAECMVHIANRDAIGGALTLGGQVHEISASYLGRATADAADSGTRNALVYRRSRVRSFFDDLRQEMATELLDANAKLVGGPYQLPPGGACASQPEVKNAITTANAKAGEARDPSLDDGGNALAAAQEARDGIALHHLLARQLSMNSERSVPASLRQCPVYGTAAEIEQAMDAGRMACSAAEIAKLRARDTEIQDYVKAALTSPYLRAGMDDSMFNLTWYGDGKLTADRFPMVSKLAALLGPGKTPESPDAQAAAVAVLKGDGRALIRQDLDKAMAALCDDASWARLIQPKALVDKVLAQSPNEDIYPAIRECAQHALDRHQKEKAIAGAVVGGSCLIASFVPGLNVLAGIPCTPAFLAISAQEYSQTTTDLDVARGCGVARTCSVEDMLTAAENRESAKANLALQAVFASFEAAGPLAKQLGAARRAQAEQKLASIMARADLAAQDREALDALNSILKNPNSPLTSAQVGRLTEGYLRGELKTAEDIEREAEIVAAENRAAANKGIRGAGDAATDADASKQARYNPTGEMDNCVACTSAFLRNAFARSMEHTAESLERAHGAAGIDQEFDLPSAIEYIQKSTRSTASPKPIGFMDAKAPPGKYAIFFGNSESYTHVVSAWITPGGRKFVFDAQIGTVIEITSPQDWAALLRKYHARGGRPYLFTPNAGE